MKIALAILLALCFECRAVDIVSGVNLVTNKASFVKTMVITNTSGADVSVAVYDCSNTNLTRSVTNIVPNPQALIGQPIATTNVTNLQVSPFTHMIVSNGCYVYIQHGLYVRGIVVTNDGPVTVSLSP